MKNRVNADMPTLKTDTCKSQQKEEGVRQMISSLNARTVKTFIAFNLALVSSFAVADHNRINQPREEKGQPIEELEVIGTLPAEGLGIARNKIPASIQSVGSEQFRRAPYPSIADTLRRHMSNISINMAQHNPLQPDLHYRGYTASPLLGLPQGLSIYQDGIRLNAPFGDNVEWDLMPVSAIRRVELISGSNPVYGLNSLGGALLIDLKDGFDAPLLAVATSGGSFKRRTANIESGNNNGTWGYYVNADYFEEDGWRENSASNAVNLLARLSRRGERNHLDLTLQFGDTELRGNGPTPTQLLAEDRDAVFTHPDLTENQLWSFSVQDMHQLTDDLTLTANAYWRRVKTRSFNGDGGEFGECTFSGNEFLIEEEEELGENEDEEIECETEKFEDTEWILDQAGRPIPAEFEAINNRGRLTQSSWGTNWQLAWRHPLWGYETQFVTGLSLRQTNVEFSSSIEAAELNPDRSTLGSGFYVPALATEMDTRTRSAGLFLTSTTHWTDRLSTTLASRYNDSRVTLRDHSHTRPALNGDHDFSRFNMSLGVTYELTQIMNLYASIGQASRTPTPIELACADPEFECRLPNAFLADPPLDQVVATSLEVGVRGGFGDTFNWSLALFHSTNRDDIIFQATGGSQASQGFFDNIDKTRRVGLDAHLDGHAGALSWRLNYGFLAATFEDNFSIRSFNHPASEDGDLKVSAGDQLPGMPRHNLNLSIDYDILPPLTLGAEMQFSSGAYLRGDEANLLDESGSYAVFALHAEYQLSDHVTISARVDNLFDRKYSTFGLLGEPDEVLGDAYNNPVFLSAGAPRAAWLGIRMTLK